MLCSCAAFTALCVAASGCAAPPPPRLSLQRVALEAQTPDAYLLTFAFDADNDSDELLPLQEVRYTLTLDNDRVFSGVRSAETALPPRSSRTVLLPVPVPATDTPDGSRPVGPAAPPTGDVAYSLTGDVTYLLPGAIAELLFDNNVRRPSASFQARGRLDFSQLEPLPEPDLPDPPRPDPPDPPR